jgi:hypothetical protein
VRFVAPTLAAVQDRFSTTPGRHHLSGIFEVAQAGDFALTNGPPVQLLFIDSLSAMLRTNLRGRLAHFQHSGLKGIDHERSAHAVNAIGAAVARRLSRDYFINVASAGARFAATLPSIERG